MKVDDTNPPKIKRFVIIGINEGVALVGYLFINTSINPNVFRTEDLKKLHLPLSKDGRPYIDYDSFLDCSHIYEMSIEKLEDVFSQDYETYLDQVSDDDMAQIRELIKAARTIPAKTKKRYGII